MRDISMRNPAAGKREKMRSRFQEATRFSGEGLRTDRSFVEILGRSHALKKVLHSVEKVAATKSSVLIMGETGTGKELIARAIHGISRRKDHPLVKINCAALPMDLIESELFGHEKGAFTGAISRRTGRFELAHGGTVFLDEIGELPFALQGKLLRVLQDGTFERVGGIQTLEVDVRIIAATNRNLEKFVETGMFREDLFYRLNGFPIFLPPLRDRMEDIPILATHFVTKYAEDDGNRIKTIPQKMLRALQSYHWPGNVRELENFIERIIITSEGSKLELTDCFPGKTVVQTEQAIPTMAEVEKNHIIRALKMSDGRVSGEKGAARLLGLNPQTLYSRIKRLDIARKMYSPG